MKRLAMMGALLGALVLGATSTSQAYYRPVARAAARVALPPYGRVIGPRYIAPRAVYGPRVYAPYRGWGPGFYGPRVGVGVGIY